MLFFTTTIRYHSGIQKWGYMDDTIGATKKLMETRLRVKNRTGRNFGKNQWEPLNDTACLFCVISGTKFFREDVLDLLLSVGYSVEYIGERSKALDSRGAIYLGDPI